jgi:predicted secreted hydrolase
VEFVGHVLNVEGATFSRTNDDSVVEFIKSSNIKAKSAKVTQWKIEIQKYNFRIEHTPGVENIPAFFLNIPTCSRD